MSEFTYCLNTSTIRPTPLLEKVAVAGKAGYQAIELWNDDVTAYVEGGDAMSDLNRAIADQGLKVVSVIALHGWVTADGAEYDAVLKECERRMNQAVALGSPYIVASPPREVVDLGKASERFGALLRLGRSLGVEPSMEFLGFVDGIKSASSAWAIASGCGEPGGTVVADVFHMIRGGGTVDDLLQLPGDRIACFHVNDMPPEPDPLTQSDADRVMVGEGIADLPRVIANLRAIGYRGPISLELFNRALWEADPYQVVKTGLDRIKALVEG
ncbi:MAG: sugar phosphate isomerase/epimerase family protein [Isosphaeraceae bacterium]